MSTGNIHREDIIMFFSELESKLNTLGVLLQFQIVGGIAQLLHRLIDRTAGDIDARYNSAHLVEQVAREMSNEYGLVADRLNSLTLIFLPNAARWIARLKGSSTAIETCRFSALAAMNVAAERQKDILDLSQGRNYDEIFAEEAIAGPSRSKLGTRNR